MNEMKLIESGYGKYKTEFTDAERWIHSWENAAVYVNDYNEWNNKNSKVVFLEQYETEYYYNYVWGILDE